jgi:hypothetical protein
LSVESLVLPEIVPNIEHRTSVFRFFGDFLKKSKSVFETPSLRNTRKRNKTKEDEEELESEVLWTPLAEKRQETY